MLADGTITCERHPNEAANLTCGGCFKGICTVCMTLTGEGPRCQDCMAKMNGVKPVEGVVIPAGQEAARQDAAKAAYYATEPTIFCARHPQTETGLRCGRCDTPICPRCMVHAGVGIRCPECAANPKRTIGRDAEIAAAAARGKAAPAETGHRNYWYKNRAYKIVQPKHYVIAAAAGIGIALVLGIAWGFLLSQGLFSTGRRGQDITQVLQQYLQSSGNTGWAGLASNGVQSSIHLIPEVVVGFLIALGIEKVTQGRVGPGLQVIAGLAVVLAIVVSMATLLVRIYFSGFNTFPPVGDLLGTTGLLIGDLTKQVGVVIFWIIGIVVAVVRLKR